MADDRVTDQDADSDSADRFADDGSGISFVDADQDDKQPDGQ